VSESVYMPDGRPAPLVLTEEEAAAILRVDGPNPGETLRNYRESGRLKGLQIGRRIRYSLKSIVRFIDLQEETVAR